MTKDKCVVHSVSCETEDWSGIHSGVTITANSGSGAVTGSVTRVRGTFSLTSPGAVGPASNHTFHTGVTSGMAALVTAVSSAPDDSRHLTTAGSIPSGSIVTEG